MQADGHEGHRPGPDDLTPALRRTSQASIASTEISWNISVIGRSNGDEFNSRKMFKFWKIEKLIKMKNWNFKILKIESLNLKI